MKTKVNYVKAVDTFDCWRDNVLTGSSPKFFPIGTGVLARIEVGPGRVTLIGGAPGAGKTAFTMQAMIDALRLTPTLRVLICNIEMTPNVLLDRQLARLSGIDLETIRYRRFGSEHADRLDQALNTIESLADRLAFTKAPFNLDNIAKSADDFQADLIVLDYIQRIPPPGEYGDKRGSVDATMNYLRQFADADVAVVVVAAVSRSKDSKGRSSYSGELLSLASFRESSELEFGADDAFILVPSENGAEYGNVKIKLRHLKARHTEPKDLLLEFDRRIQRFSEADDPRLWKPDGGAARPDRSKVQDKLAAARESTAAANDDQGGEEW
jgi:replicative DNA helicase